jgi:hypothetical protein
MNVFIMQIDYVKISCKEDVHIYHTNFAKKMERNLHEITSRWKTYGKLLTLKFEMNSKWTSTYRSKVALDVRLYWRCKQVDYTMSCMVHG